VNALAAYEPFAPEPLRNAVPFERALTSEDLLAYLRERLPAAGVLRVVVLEIAGIHTSRAVRAARPALAKPVAYLYRLPAYSPELNRIEPVVKQVKYYDIPVRSYTSNADLRQAVEAGFDAYRRRLTAKGHTTPASCLVCQRRGQTLTVEREVHFQRRRKSHGRLQPAAEAFGCFEWSLVVDATTAPIHFGRSNHKRLIIQTLRRSPDPSQGAVDRRVRTRRTAADTTPVRLFDGAQGHPVSLIGK
jgi:transposase